MIGMHLSLSSHQEKQRARARRKEKEWRKRQHQRSVDQQRQYQRAEKNILRFMRKDLQLNSLCGTSLQGIALDLAETPEVRHCLDLRRSGMTSYLELMMHTLCSMIETECLTLHEDEGCVWLGFTKDTARPKTEAPLTDEVEVEVVVDFDWSITRIVKCSKEIYAALTEY